MSSELPHGYDPFPELEVLAVEEPQPQRDDVRDMAKSVREVLRATLTLANQLYGDDHHQTCYLESAMIAMLHAADHMDDFIRDRERQRKR